MNETSSIDDLLGGVIRVLDQHPDVRARIVLLELARVNGNGAVAAVMPVAGDGAGAADVAGALVRPAFNLAGHAVIAYVAEQYLEQAEPDVYEALQRLKAADTLGRGDIGSFAMWPDQIKHPPRGREAEFEEQKKRLGSDREHWHYVNIPYDPSKPRTKPDLAKASGDLLKQLPGQLELLATDDPLDAADALSYVLHLVGDLHQPLHCAALADGKYFTTPPEFDRGGNLIRWGTERKRGTANLHALWDDGIAASGNEVERRVQDTLAKYPRTDFSDDLLAMSLEDVALESFDLAKSAYDDFLGEATYLGESTMQAGGQQFSAPTPEYRAKSRDILRKRGALAAYRLARLLATYLPGARRSNGHRAPAKKRRAKR